MKIGILGSKGGWHETKLEQALLERGAGTLIAQVTGLTARIGCGEIMSAQGRPLTGCAAVIVRAIPSGSLEQIIFRMDALHRLTRLGVPVVNSPRCIERTVDKYFTSTLLEDAGLPTPRSVICERFEDAMAAFEELGRDAVVKPLFGSEGRGMTRISDVDIAYRTFRALELGRAVFYLQEYVPHAGRDIRAFVVGGRVVAAMMRCGEGWKTNLAQGARAEPLEPSAQICELGRRAADVMEAGYAGVDLLPSEDGRLWVLEVNGIPGWRGLQQTTCLDIGGAIADHVLGVAARTLDRDAADE
jgi:RimK family alpha-L-glutamate ligase